VCEGRDAEYLLGTGTVEIVKRLRPKKHEPEQPSPGGFQTGRSEDDD
jgi:hypothetical protein